MSQHGGGAFSPGAFCPFPLALTGITVHTKSVTSNDKNKNVCLSVCLKYMVFVMSINSTVCVQQVYISRIRYVGPKLITSLLIRSLIGRRGA